MVEITSIIIPLIAAGIGGTLAYYAASKAADKAHRHNLELFEKNEQISESILISSLMAELLELKKLIEREFKERLLNSDSEMFEWIFPDDTDYFVVFNSSANQLGKIKDEALREKFISAYMEGKFFYDSMKMNTFLCNKRYELCIQEIHFHPVSVTRVELSKWVSEMEENLKHSKSNNLAPSCKRLLAQIDELNSMISNKV